MEDDNEVYSSDGTSYDFGARIYNPRIGRWLSIDPLRVKNQHESNYSYAANNPILFLDIEGKDNIIYIVVQQSDDPETTNLNAQQIADEANQFLDIMGLNTRVVVFDEATHGEFSSEFIDATDSYAYIGSYTFINDRGMMTMGGALENAQNGGTGIATITDEFGKFSVLPVSSQEELAAFAVLHGAGHNAADPNLTVHALLIDNILEDVDHTNNANFMADGPIIGALFEPNKSVTYYSEESGMVNPADVQGGNPAITSMDDLFAPERNQVNIANFQQKFGTNTATDNYGKNKNSSSSSSNSSQSSGSNVKYGGVNVGGNAKKAGAGIKKYGGN